MKRLNKERAPQRATPKATAILREANSGHEIAQVEELLERFAKITIPDLWHYGAGLQKVDRVTFSSNPQFGQEVVEFWHLANELQRALRKAAEGGGTQ